MVARVCLAVCAFFALASCVAGKANKFNIIHTTDVHGWVFGHPHNATLNADFGDFQSFLQHMAQNAQTAGEEFLVFDSGDIIEGTGLSDASQIHGQYIFPIFQNINYNGLTIGNHDIGHPQVIDLMEDGFIPFFNPANATYPKYLTMNSFLLPSESYIGQPYAVIDTPFGNRVLVLGFIYNFTHEANNTNVMPVSQALLQPAFQKAMAVPNVDVIVVIAHIAPQFPPELPQIYKAIRTAHADTPLALLVGHSHVTDFVQNDPNAFTLESGKYFEVIGNIQFSLGNDGSMQGLKTQWVDTSVDNLMTLSATTKTNFLTPQGAATKAAIWKAYAQLGLNITYGCAPQTFIPDTYFRASNSLYWLFIQEIFPHIILQGQPSDGIGFFLANPSTLRYSLFAGPVTRNDIYTISPFNDTFWHFPQLTGTNLSKLLKAIEYVTDLDDRHQERALCGATYEEAPAWYYSETDIEDTQKYDLVLSTYDAATILPAVQKLLGSNVTPKIYDTDVNGTGAIQMYVEKFWPCSSN